jgi:predicted Fe-Mo cluster-binding NifX family protein
MKIAVASQNRREITGHTGLCRRFWIYDIGRDGEIAVRQLLELERERALHASARHEPHPLDQVDVLISAGMGQGMRGRLAAMGVTAVVTSDTDPDHAVRAWLDGTLMQAVPETVQTASHEHKHGHGATGGCGCGRSHGAAG